MAGRDADEEDADRVAAPPGGYRVAVPVIDPANVRQLMRTALDLARANDGDVLVVSVIVKPHESPFSLFTDEVIRREFGGDRREILDRALAAAEGSEVPIRGRLLIAPDVASALLDAVDEYDCDALLVGWHQRDRRNVVFGRNVDRVVERAPCDVLVERIGPTADGVEALLLPIAEGPHTDLATEVARAIALGNDARVDVLHVLDPAATVADREAARDRLRAVADRLAPVEHVTTTLQEGEDVAESVVAAAANRDVTVVGATRRGRLRRLVAGTVPRKLGRQAPSTVIVARRGGHGAWTPRRFLRRLRGR